VELTKYIEEHGVSIAKFARKVGVTPTTIHNLLEGRDVKLSIGVKIQRVTKGKVTCEEIFSELIEPKKKPEA
jgi:DNA-binding transcriptional regulator YdaS (Cro superfamily)